MSMKIFIVKISNMSFGLRVRRGGGKAVRAVYRASTGGVAKGRGQRASENRQVQVDLRAKRVEEGRGLGSETARGYTWEETTSV